MEPKKLSSKVIAIRRLQGLSQEQLARQSSLHLRTIQRIEKDETIPRGDTLKRIAGVLGISMEELSEGMPSTGSSMGLVLVLSQLVFLVFPILGMIVPLIIWITQRDKAPGLDDLGKRILNFQITWTIGLFAFASIVFIPAFIPTSSDLWLDINERHFLGVIFALYVYNLAMITVNVVFLFQKKQAWMPAITFLR
ncbi:MAG: helix-turn-helix domain-containing protein [Cyclobacteriaceae bacterium]|nr:helix-turn-helix domain-containing protein [Cyclobacteriaceae bacterium HetDA_MAG_MS6]